MIYKLASTFSVNNREDLFQVGVIGLINAYNNYNPIYNTKFSTYAYPFILGEMKSYIRQSKGIKVSREISYLSSRLDKLIELLSQKYNRIPTTLELSSETGIEEWKIIEALDIRNCIRSLDDKIDDNTDKTSLIDLIPSSEDVESRALFDDLVDSLDDCEKEFVKERFFYDKSQTEIGISTGYSQAKVSRMEQKILKKLRSYYKTS